MDKSKIKLIKFLLILIAFSVLPCMLLNYIIDPLQFYRRSYYFNNTLYEYQRYQNPGLARTYEYDSVIIGTSMTENFLPRDTKSILGLETLKLSISAGSAYEQAMMLKTAIRTGKVDTVIWGIDLSAFRGAPDRKGVREEEFPAYMYDDSGLNDFLYLLNDKTTELSIKTLIRFIGSGPANKYIDISRYSFWYPYAVFGEKQMLERGAIFEAQNAGLGSEYDIDELIQSATHNLILLIEANPGIHFIIFYTPASVMRDQFFIKENIFDMQLEFKKFLNNELLSYDNVSMFDFQAAEEIILDLDRYSDYSHYDLSTMVYMLECINRNRYLVTREDILIERHEQLVRGYSLN